MYPALFLGFSSTSAHVTFGKPPGSLPPLGPRRIQASVRQGRNSCRHRGWICWQAHKAPAWVQSGCWWWGINAGAALTWDCAPGGLVPAVRGWTLRAEFGGWPCPGREGVRLALCSSARGRTWPPVHVVLCVWCPDPDSPFNRDPCCVGLGHT